MRFSPTYARGRRQIRIGASFNDVQMKVESIADRDPLSPMHRGPEGIAIIGMAGRFPKARNLNEFWQNLCGGREAISFFTDEELAAAGVTQTGDSRYVKARGVLEDADLFDAAFFGLNPKEAEVLDPQHRLFLECACEALEN